MSIDSIAYNTVDHNNFSNNGNIGLYLCDYSNSCCFNTIDNNNFMKNGVHNAYFEGTGCKHNNWNRNYWSNSISHGLLPTIIPGKKWLTHYFFYPPFFIYPSFNVDWFPAFKPFDIGG